jgi:3',5'-cyclic AMP phosphodiesterase CpdA
MPLHLLSQNPGENELSRRSFLGRAGALAAGLFVAPAVKLRGAGARPPASKESCWALLSDTHIAAAVEEVSHGFTMAKNLQRVIEEVLAARAGACILNGDVALTLGVPGDYESFLRLIEPLRAAGLPLHMTVGNHDDRKNFLEATAAAIRRSGGGSAVAGKYSSVLEAAGLRWFFLDSLDQVNAVPGLLGEEQIRWLARELDLAAAAPAVIFLHHNVEATSIGLQDTEALLSLLRPREQVKAVFFGHTHVWKTWEDSGIHMVNLPAVGYPFDNKNWIGWVRAELQPEGMELELRSLDASHQDHMKTLKLSWRPQRRRVRAL